MYEYKTEILSTGIKLFSAKANEADVSQFNEIFTESCVDGWELLTYSYMATALIVKGALLVTYRRLKQQ
jgi:hypothetical protein